MTKKNILKILTALMLMVLMTFTVSCTVEETGIEEINSAPTEKVKKTLEERQEIAKEAVAEFIYRSTKDNSEGRYEAIDYSKAKFEAKEIKENDGKIEMIIDISYYNANGEYVGKVENANGSAKVDEYGNVTGISASKYVPVKFAE